MTLEHRPRHSPLPGSTWNLPDPIYDLIVVGAGHAGVEAALAGARMGLRTLMISMSLQTIGQMSCNPAIGGIGKGQIVREIDALGGEMGRAADISGIQFRMLNRSKGPAVWSPRAQSDKPLFARHMTRALFSTPGLDLRQGMVTDLEVVNGRVLAVVLSAGTRIRGATFILCAGTFLNGLVHVGDNSHAGGRAGEPPATGLSEALTRLGIQVKRYKTGTPPRVDRDSVNFKDFEAQAGDVCPQPFRYFENLISQPQLVCHITWTSAATHQVLLDNLHRSPMYAGRIEGVGPRYCPSVEDKVVRFADKERHLIFLEPESHDSREMYVNGFSTSMPEDVQLLALRTVPGFENVRFTRPGYAIEYDYFPAWQIDTTLAARGVANLFFAGQINGTSGYEEAAAQGLLAAINAAAFLDKNRDPLILGRDLAYMGVLVDDLVNKPLPEPYRMFTSRAEFRLLLRQDNADERLMPVSRQLGLLENWRWEVLLRRRELRGRLIGWLHSTSIQFMSLQPAPHAIGAESVGESLSESTGLASSGARGSLRAADLLRRPEVTLQSLLHAAGPPWAVELDDSLILGVEMDHKYEGYVNRQRNAVESFRRNESVQLPLDINYAAMKSLSNEARDRLAKVQPRSLGQASRIGGVNPTDIQALWVALQRHKAGTQTS